MSQPSTQRPPQTTLASGIIMLSSVVVLLTVWERLSGLGSLETQEQVRDVLAGSPSSPLSVAQATELLRITCMVAAVSACATAILGWYVRRPDRASRLGLTVFAVVVFVSGLATGGLASSFVAAGAAMLWMQPSREWFATGRWTPPVRPVADSSRAERKGSGQDSGQGSGQGSAAPWGAPPAQSPPQSPPQPPPSARPFGEPAPPTGAPGAPGTSAPPPATSPYGQPYPQPYPQHPGQHPGPWVQGAHPAPGGPRPSPWQPPLPERPRALVAAFVITVVSSGGLLAMSLLWIAVAGLSPDILMSVLREQQPQLVEDGITAAQVRSTVLAMAGVFVVWCVVALVLAGFAMARREWARRGLMVCAALAAGACAALSVSAPPVLLLASAGIATVVCLRRGDVRRWFSHVG